MSWKSYDGPSVISMMAWLHWQPWPVRLYCKIEHRS